jgi:thiol-disulfide isomerase/thioredoxin
MEMLMKKTVIYLVLLLGMVSAVPVFSEEPAATAEILPNLILTVPENDFYKEYLGLTGKTGESFAVTDIQADILLIELFSMYCPFCQKEAPIVNELYEKMVEVSQKGPIVKIIGLGASNSQFEVDHFKETYNVPFPLFPDQDMSMYKALAGEGTPGFIGCRIESDGKATIVLRNSGGFYNADDFLKELIESGGL